MDQTTPYCCHLEDGKRCPEPPKYEVWYPGDPYDSLHTCPTHLAVLTEGTNANVYPLE